MRRFLNSQKVGYIFILPWILGFLAFTAYPIFYSLYLSFFNVVITATGLQTNFIQFENFRNILTTDLDFLRMAGAFFRESLVSVPLIVILALIMALLLNQPIKARGLFRTIFFLPVIISSGPVMEKLIDLGVTTIPNLADYQFYQVLALNNGFFLVDILLYILNHTIVLLWLSGVQILIFLAALQKVDRQVYEAARIDGASTWEIFWKITLPTLFPMILVNIIYTTVMYASSALNPIVAHISSHMFRVETGFGYASALSWIYFVIIAIILGVLAGIFMLMEKKSLN